MKFTKDNIFRMGCYNIRRLAEDHNKENFPASVHGANHGKRLKPSDIRVLECIWRQKVDQMWIQYQNGRRSFDGLVSTNRVEASNYHNDKKPCRQINHKLAKGVLAGIFFGYAMPNDNKEYGDKYARKGGNGVGTMAWKRLHGRKKNFDICFTPEVFPLGNFPQDALVSVYDPRIHFPEGGRQKQLTTAAKPFNPQPNPNKVTNPHLPTDKTFKPIKESSIQKAAAEGSEAEQAAAAVAAFMGEGPSAGDQTEDLAGAADGKRKNVVKPPSEDKKREVAAGENFTGRDVILDTGQSIFRKLFMAGQKKAAYAIFLVQMYCWRLAAAMELEYHPKEVERGIRSARKLFVDVPEDQIGAEADRFRAVIEHMEAWIRKDPQRNYVLPPGTWFDPDQRTNIIGAEERYLIPHIQNGKKWKDQLEAKRAARELTGAEKRRYEEEKAKGCSYYNQALIMRKHLEALFPTDFRVKRADLYRWSGHIEALHKRDRIPFSQIQETWLWYVRSDKRAKVWREEFGVKSPSGFRRNFHKIHENMSREVKKPKRQKKYTGR